MSKHVKPITYKDALKYRQPTELMEIVIARLNREIRKSFRNGAIRNFSIVIPNHIEPGDAEELKRLYHHAGWKIEAEDLREKGTADAWRFTRGQAERLADLLRKLGWSVAVEPGPPWTFETIEDRARFEADWDASLPLLFKHAGEPGLPKTLREVAIEALNLADTCEAGGVKISVILHRLKDVREAAVVECIAVVDELFSTVADVS